MPGFFGYANNNTLVKSYEAQLCDSEKIRKNR